ncbi:MAG: DUF6504 family protein [Pseudomonadota bacterium]|nr:DUF6504 family protein [Pseudomonadota bacterium]
MQRRFVSLWLPHWSTDRLRRSAPAEAGTAGRPLALVRAVQGGMRLVAVDAVAVATGLAAGMTLADARAVAPELVTRPAEPEADAAALAALARWCQRYSPWTAVDGDDGIIIESTGCDHLFAGEAAMLADMVTRLGRGGITVRPALAPTPGAAWALARFATPRAGEAGPVAPEGETMVRLAALPVAALRLPDETVEGLKRLGLHRIGALYRLPRAGLSRRFGGEPVRRLDQALGRVAEPLSPLQPGPEYRVRLDFGEPIGAPEDIARAAGRLLERLGAWLADVRCGSSRLELTAFRADGGVAAISVGCARASRDVAHWRRLFAERLAELDPGFGVDAMILAAPRTEPLAALQPTLDHGAAPADAVARLVDRLRNRLGGASVRVQRPGDSHLPERAVRLVPPPAGGTATDAWPGLADRPARPLRLLPVAEPVEALALAPDHPPHGFRWRRVAFRVAAAEGPERIAPEWWQDMAPPDTEAAETRDYYRVETTDGRCFWLCRTGLHDRGDGTRPPRWLLHGVF